MTDLNLKAEYKLFDGKLGFYSHLSACCNGEMRFSVYQPPQTKSQNVPILYFLSGLTCTEENFMVKAGAQRFAAKYGFGEWHGDRDVPVPMDHSQRQPCSSWTSGANRRLHPRPCTRWPRVTLTAAVVPQLAVGVCRYELLSCTRP